MASKQRCPGTRRVPIENINPAPAEWKDTYAQRYGIAHCMVCRRWFTAHKDGTPVYHAAAESQP